jgi:hypothetical protein
MHHLLTLRCICPREVCWNSLVKSPGQVLLVCWDGRCDSSTNKCDPDRRTSE